MMYGKYDLPCQLTTTELQLVVEQQGQQFHYRRTCGAATVEKTLLLNKRELILHPVEPRHTPKALTSYFLLEFERPVGIEPKVIRTFFLTFPVEIGVFIRLRGKEFTLLDVFSLVPPKFTLYGDPDRGLICRYWKSPLYDTPPTPSPWREGIFELTLTNADNDWNDITKAVFDAQEMKLFYDERRVTLRAKMKLTDGSMAETIFLDAPLETGMKRAVKTYTTRKLTLLTAPFIMEHGR